MIRAVIFDMYETLITHYRCPLYFGAQMAKDAGVQEEKFQEIWHATNDERTTGKMTFEEVIEKILRENACYSEELLNEIVEKRVKTKEECFRHLHPEIFRRCMNLLSVKAEECIYIGDGGSQELEAAKNLGMNALQATWYFQKGTFQPCGPKDDFEQLTRPLDVIKMVL